MIFILSIFIVLLVISLSLLSLLLGVVCPPLFEDSEVTLAMEEEVDSFRCPSCSSRVRSTEYLSDFSSDNDRLYHESMLWGYD